MSGASAVIMSVVSFHTDVIPNDFDWQKYAEEKSLTLAPREIFKPVSFSLSSLFLHLCDSPFFSRSFSLPFFLLLFLLLVKLFFHKFAIELNPRQISFIFTSSTGVTHPEERKTGNKTVRV